MKQKARYKIKIKTNILDLIKESPDEHKVRVRDSGTAYRTRIIDTSKNIYKRNRYKKFNLDD